MAEKISRSRDFGLDVGALTDLGGGAAVVRKQRRGKADTPFTLQAAIAEDAKQSQRRTASLLAQQKQVEGRELAEQEGEVARRRFIAAKSRKSPRSLLV